MEEEEGSLDGGGEPDVPVGGVAGEADGDGASDEVEEEDEEPPGLLGMKMAAEDMTKKPKRAD